MIGVLRLRSVLRSGSQGSLISRVRSMSTRSRSRGVKLLGTLGLGAGVTGTALIISSPPAPEVIVDASKDVVEPTLQLRDEDGRILLRPVMQLLRRALELLLILSPPMALYFAMYLAELPHKLHTMLFELPVLRLMSLPGPLDSTYCAVARFRARMLARARTAWLKQLVGSLANCGPAGIKWGQWASTRYDLFDDEFCEALGELTNQAPVHDYAWTELLVERAFSAKMNEIFDEFQVEPLASGSIAQVHLARLRGDSTTVAVKVQHPGLGERLGIDMLLLRTVAEIASSLPALKDMRIHETIDQFATNFAAQLDFNDEAENLRLFARNFASPFWQALVSFPKPIDHLVSAEVLVETFESGVSVAEYLKRHGSAMLGDFDVQAAVETALNGGARIKKAHVTNDVQTSASADESADHELGSGAALTAAALGEARRAAADPAIRENISLCGIQTFLKMVIWDNFIHADLHPGNVLIRMQQVGPVARLQRFVLLGETAKESPHIVLLDAGLAARFNPEVVAYVNTFFRAITTFDGDTFGESILGMSPQQPFVKSREAFCEEVKHKMAKMEDNLKERGEGRAGDNIRDFMASVRAHNVIVDPSVMVTLMSMMVLEGWQFRLDPQVSVFGNVKMAIDGGLFGFVNKMTHAASHYSGLVRQAVGVAE